MPWLGVVDSQCSDLLPLKKNPTNQVVTVADQTKGVMTGSMVDALSELYFPFLKRGNSAFIAAIASGPFPKNECRSFEELWPEWSK